ncbi:MAG: 1-phosphofructokinase family hexose kinase [Caldilineaceae bacterium]|nr:1-phosphofructokinase family hexose kinase [Caldilineaceae bacterium]
MPPIYTVTLNPGLDRTLTVPALYENSVLRATSSKLDWGGKGFNVTRALQALGVESVALGLVGGFTGQMLTQGLADLGITTDFVQIPGETRTNTVIEESGSGRHLKVNEAGPTIDAAAIDALRARILAHLRPGSYWALCGSLPPGAPPSLYADLTTLIQSHGAFVCLDASGEALRLGLTATPFLVKPNAEEAAGVTGITISDAPSTRRATAALIDQGAEWVALSLGADGLLLTNGDQSIYARPPQVAVQTLVGVGDALLAGLLYALHHKLPLAGMARWGVAAGTAAAMTPGVGVGSVGEVRALVARVSLETAQG